jgi:hypothetical protein
MVTRDMVADAVKTKPVSAPLFPVNREKNREFSKIAATGALHAVDITAVTGLSIRIPYSAEQGIIFAKQGSSVREQGI